MVVVESFDYQDFLDRASKAAREGRARRRLLGYERKFSLSDVLSGKDEVKR